MAGMLSRARIASGHVDCALVIWSSVSVDGLSPASHRRRRLDATLCQWREPTLRLIPRPARRDRHRQELHRCHHCRFRAQRARIVSVSATTITVESPAGTALVDVVVTTPVGHQQNQRQRQIQLRTKA